MWWRFTRNAQRAVLQSRDEAAALGSGVVRGEHLVLAVCRDMENVAVRALVGLNVDVVRFRELIEELAPKATTPAAPESLAFSPLTVEGLREAVTTAGRLNHNYIGTEHILIGLLEAKEPLAAKLLEKWNVGLDAIEAEVLRLLERDGREEVSENFPEGH